MSEISVELGTVTIGGGTGDFEELENRPKYNGAEMTHLTDIPVGKTALSEMSSDSTHRVVTDAEKTAWNAKADADDIPTELSELNGDATHRTVTDAEKTAWNAKAETSAIPTKTSQLTNDSGYLTRHQDISGKVDKTTTVNGQALSSNVLLDGDDINVDESAETKQTIKAALTSQSSQIDTLEQLMPEDEPSAVGKILKVLAVNEDGTFTCEWADAPSSGVTDVQVNGTSIVSGGVATIPIINSDTGPWPIYYGLVRTNKWTCGIYNISGYDGLGCIVLSAEDFCSSARIANIAISKGTLNNVLKTPSIQPSLTSSEQQAALTRLGITVDSEGYCKFGS